MKYRSGWYPLGIYLLLSAGAVTMVVPFLWMISTSLKTDSNVFSTTIELIPDPIVWSNYVRIWEFAPFGKFFLNTLKVTVLVTAGRLLISSMAAYSFSRLRFPGRDLLFMLFLATMMIPYHVTVVPLFVIMRELNWINTHWAIIVPNLFSAFGVFLLRQFMIVIPREIEEAARIDGSGFMRTFWTIVLPLTVPALTALGIFSFMGTWNDFFGPLIFLNSQHMYTLQIGLASLVGMYQTDWTLMMTGAVLTLLPILIIFFLAQKQFIEGITLQGSLKG